MYNWIFSGSMAACCFPDLAKGLTLTIPNNGPGSDAQMQAVAHKETLP